MAIPNAPDLVQAALRAGERLLPTPDIPPTSIGIRNEAATILAGALARALTFIDSEWGEDTVAEILADAGLKL